jgi:hypothetical protein
MIPENGGSPAADRLNHILPGWKRSRSEKRPENCPVSAPGRKTLAERQLADACYQGLLLQARNTGPIGVRQGNVAAKAIPVWSSPFS